MGSLTRTKPAPGNQAEKSHPEIGDMRRMGPFGPVYEVIAIENAEAITVRELQSERITQNYPIADFQNDLIE